MVRPLAFTLLPEKSGFSRKNLLRAFKLTFIEHLFDFLVRYRFNSSNQKTALMAVIST